MRTRIPGPKMPGIPRVSVPKTGSPGVDDFITPDIPPPRPVTGTGDNTETPIGSGSSGTRMGTGDDSGETVDPPSQEVSGNDGSGSSNKDKNQEEPEVPELPDLGDGGAAQTTILPAPTPETTVRLGTGAASTPTGTLVPASSASSIPEDSTGGSLLPIWAIVLIIAREG